MTAKRLLSVVFMFASLALLIYAVGLIGNNFRYSSTSKLEQLWTEDMGNLSSMGKLPAHWNDIRLVEKTAATGDRVAERWIRGVNVPIKVNPTGEYKLEILYLSQNDNSHLRAIIQMDLVHISTGNSVWEFSRTYDLK